MGQHRAGRAAPDLLVQLAQLAPDGDRAVAQHVQHGLERGRQPVGAFVGDQGAGLARQGRQRGAQRLLAARQEADEQEAVGRQAGRDQGRHHGGRAGQRDDRNLARQRLADQLVAGIGDARHARVGDERHVPGGQRVEHRVELGQLIVLVIAGHRRGDRVVVEQHARGARVLGGDQAGLAQNPQRAQRDIFQVADGGGNDIQRGHASDPSV